MKYECNKIKDLLAPYLDNVLESVLKKEVEEHLTECKKCKNLSEDLKKILFLSGKMDKTQLSADVLNKITERFEDINPEKNYQPTFRWVSVIVFLVVCGITGYYVIGKKEMRQFPQQRVISIQIEKPQEEMVAVTSPKKTNKSKITEEKKISEKVIELAKLPEQIENKKIVFRGGEAVIKKKFLLEWKGFSEVKENDKYLIINNQKDWQNIYTWHFNSIVPEIDFKKNIIIAAFSEANELQITEIKESKYKYYINIKETFGKEEKSETILGNPFHIVLLNK